MTPQQISQATLAFMLANGFATQLITLSVAMIGLTVTFAKDFKLPRSSLIPLVLIWITFFLSIICGISTIKALITVVSPLKPTDAPFAISDVALWWARWQEWLFFIGLILFIGNGAFIIRSKRSA